MTENDQSPDSQDLKDLDSRLRRVRTREEEKSSEPRAEVGQMGIAFRMATEMAAGLMVGGVLGWWIDSWLNTRPWGLLLLLVLGAAAGTRGAFREAQKWGSPTNGAPE